MLVPEYVKKHGEDQSQWDEKVIEQFRCDVYNFLTTCEYRSLDVLYHLLAGKNQPLVSIGAKLEKKSSLPTPSHKLV